LKIDAAAAAGSATAGGGDDGSRKDADLSWATQNSLTVPELLEV
jgi:hypothetical protein